MRMNAKELIAEARVTAPTLPPAAAKLMSDMADRLDVQYAVIRESQAQLHAVVAENAIRGDIIGRLIGQYGAAGYHAIQNSLNPAQSLMYDAMQAMKSDAGSNTLAALRAESRKEGAIFAANRMLAAWDAGFVEDTPENAADIARAILTSTEFMDDAPEGDFDRSFADEMLKDIGVQIRSQPASPAIVPLPVERDQYGYWTHPVYNDFCDGREHIPTAEFNAWMAANGLEWTVIYRDEEDIDPAVDGYDISKWQPETPAGEGWFIGSIHDTEDGAVCIWLRNKSETQLDRQSVQVKGAQS